ncbi:hypothetical protein KKF34_10105 [Myxococcota bacterium]|nr:hypothetical protein [Myxococcota bacterium]MBU1382518.1 hypothetical protein [Myxococcota bacterium]MBU1497219.1 hypothetical protein [Myxococcota bacterium]
MRKSLFILFSVLTAIAYSGCDDDDSNNSSSVCEGITCSGHGTCFDVGGNPSCACELGYHSQQLNCLSDTNPCEGVTCSGHGTCVDMGNGSVSCNCETGYHAESLDCVEDDAVCEGITCSGHGTCSDDGSGNPLCNCETGYHADGTECIADSIVCEGITCSGHGTCSDDGSGNPVCNCETGYHADGTECIRDNSAPQITSTPETDIYSGSMYTYDITCTDADGDTLTLNVESQDTCGGNITDNGNGTGSYSFTPTAAGNCNMSIECCDGSLCGIQATIININNNPESWDVLSSTYNHTCGIKSGILYCWGMNSNGQLGNNSITDRFYPTRVEGVGWTHVAAGYTHTCGIKGGYLFCWGEGIAVGDGTNIDKLVPTQVGLSNAWTYITSGGSFSCGLRGGELYCWGYNYSGQLGNGTNTVSYAPVKIGTDTDWSIVSAGGGHTCGLRNQNLYCWGNNSYNQSGPVYSNVPLRVGIETGWTTVSSGYSHTCGIIQGNLFCWGANSDYQLGTGDSVNKTNPVKIGTDIDWTFISSGNSHTCGIRTSGALYCWGRNLYHQLGDGAESINTPAQIGVDTWGVVTTGERMSCGLLSGNDLYCWGNNNWGQCGSSINETYRWNSQDGKLWDIVSPQKVTSSEKISLFRQSKVAFSENDTTVNSFLVVLGSEPSDDVNVVLAPDVDGRIVLDATQLLFTPENWSAPQIVHYSADLTNLYDDDDVNLNIESGPAVSADAGYNELAGNSIPLEITDDDTFGFILTTDKRINLPEGSTGAYKFVLTSKPYGNVSVPVISSNPSILIPDVNNIVFTPDNWNVEQTVNVSIAEDNVENFDPRIFRLFVGPAVSSDLQYNNLSMDDLYIETGVSGIFSDISCGEYGCCAIDFNQNLWCWGDKGKRFETISNVLSVSVGGSLGCVLKSDQSVWCWGGGQLGDGTTNSSTDPVQVLDMTNAESISCGYFHCCAIIDDGSLKCWGRNSSGQLGIGNTGTYLSPVTVPLTGVNQISLGFSHSCALLNDETVKCWGSNSSGQIGDGTSTSRLSPVSVVGLSGVSAIAVNGASSCALLSDKTVKCWGSNSSGQVGDGTTYSRNTPNAVINLTEVRELIHGGTGVTAIKEDNTILSWGNNYRGFLGDGTTINRSSPVESINYGATQKISRGDQVTCIIDDGNKVKCLGSNEGGNLGIGTNYDNLDHLFPEFVQFETEIPAHESVTLTEIHWNPSVVDDTYGEFIELYNYTSKDVNFFNCSLLVGSTEYELEDIVIPSLGTVVFASNDNPLTNGGFTADGLIYGGFTLENSNAETISVKCYEILEMDSIDFAGAALPAGGDGISMQLGTEFYSNKQNDSSAAWCDSSQSYGDGDLGTPGAMNELCTKNIIYGTSFTEHPPWTTDGQWASGMTKSFYTTIPECYSSNTCLGSNLELSYWGSDDYSTGYVVSPPIDLTGVTTAQLNFKAYIYADNYSEYYGFQVSTNSGAMTNTLTETSLPYTSSYGWHFLSDDWHDITVDLTPWAGSIVYLKFGLRGWTSFGSGIYIDDLFVTGN